MSSQWLIVGARKIAHSISEMTTALGLTKIRKIYKCWTDISSMWQLRAARIGSPSIDKCDKHPTKNIASNHIPILNQSVNAPYNVNYIPWSFDQQRYNYWQYSIGYSAITILVNIAIVMSLGQTSHASNIFSQTVKLAWSYEPSLSAVYSVLFTVISVFVSKSLNMTINYQECTTR